MAPPVTPPSRRFLPESGRQGAPAGSSSQAYSQHLGTSATQQFRAPPQFQSWQQTQRIREGIDSCDSSPAPLFTDQASQSRRQNLVEHIYSSSPAAPDERKGAFASEPFPVTGRHWDDPLSAHPGQQDSLHDLVVLSSSPPAPGSFPASPVADVESEPPRREDAPPWLPAPRFILPTKQPSQIPLGQQFGDLNAPLLKTARPGFVLPPLPIEGEPSTAVSSLFSPHKIGQAPFVAGGLASILRDWILDLEVSPAASGLDESRRKRLRLGDVEAKLAIVDVVGQGPGVWLAQAEDGSSWVFVGVGGCGESDPRTVRQGDTVSVKPPTWTISLGDGRKNVSVRWAVQ